MIPLSAHEFSFIVQGELFDVQPEMIITQTPVIDSRSASSENFFVAFKGEKVDGHDFVAAALQNGASFALVIRKVPGPCIVVDDVVDALSKLATYIRENLKEMKVIAITGSQGKTTTKDLLFHILQTVAPTVASIGNLNNEIGVPLTLLRCSLQTRFCIVEMGARHVGDIAHLVHIADPDIGVVLVVGQAHIGEFGTRENIAIAKSEIIRELRPGSIAILGNYDEFTPRMGDNLSVKKISFGERSFCDIRAADIEFREGRAHFDLVTPDGRVAVGLQLLGLHQIPNALAAAAVATAIGVPIDSIAATLSTAEPSSKWRMELHDESGLVLINDSYNANPESMAAALRTLALLAQERGGRSWAFLGKMGELGASESQEHLAIGRLISDIGIDHLVCVGTTAYVSDSHARPNGGSSEGEETSIHFYSTSAAANEIADHFEAGDVVLVKASRADHLDELATSLLESWRVKIA